MLMRATLMLSLILSLMLALTIGSSGQTRPANLKPSSVEAKALAFFERIEDQTFDDYLKRVRLPKVSPAFKAEVMARLAISDEIKPPERMMAKLAALAPALRFHERDKVVDIKIVNLPHAFVGLQGRAALLISEKALSLMATEELLAVVAHEMGHEYFWGEFVEARQQKKHELTREIELLCDGIAVITLGRLAIDPANLVSGITRINNFNARVTTVDNHSYPSPDERFKFIRAIAELVKARNETTAYITLRRPTSP
jgi:Zn-dependent protease with chaperone function